MIAQLTAAPEPAGPTLEDFGQDPLWITIIKAVFIFVFLLLGVLFGVWFERKLISRMQHRYGPNRAGKFGLLQSVADGLKMGLKEDILPRTVDKVVYVLAPVIIAVPAFLAFSVIPFGPKVSMFGVETPLQLTDLPVAVLLVLAMASIGVYGIVLGGWASRSPYAMLGGLRSSAQVVSYEIAMGLSFVAVFLLRGHAVHLGDRGQAGARRHARAVRAVDPDAVVVRRAAVPVVRDLRDHDVRRDEPAPLRPARGRGRAGRRLPHRVLLVAEVRPVHARRVHQHVHRLGDVRSRCSSAAGGRRGRSRCGTGRTPAGGRCSGSSSSWCSSSPSSSGCAPRCRASGTTS